MASFAAAAPLRRRDFRFFWFGQWISQFGDNIFMVAQVWIIYQLTGSPAAMATVALCGRIPSIGMILLGGALVLLAAGLLYAGALAPPEERTATNSLLNAGSTAAGLKLFSIT